MQELKSPDRELVLRRRDYLRLPSLALPFAAMARPATAAVQAGPPASTLGVGPGERFRTLAEAVKAAGDGATIALQPGTYPGDVAVITQPRLTIRGLRSHRLTGQTVALSLLTHGRPLRRHEPAGRRHGAPTRRNR
jgi:hypothetical protein